MRAYTLHGMIGLTTLAEIPPTASVSPDIGSEQRELDLKGLPHFHLQDIVLQTKESVRHSPNTCSTAQVSMMFEVPPSAIHFPAVGDNTSPA